MFEVERDQEIEDRIKYNVLKFWHDYLDPNIMPPFDPQRDERLVKLLYPKDTGTTIDLTRDNRALALAEDLVLKQAGRKRLDTEIDGIKTELQGKIGDNSFATLADGRRLSWRASIARATRSRRRARACSECSRQRKARHDTPEIGKRQRSVEAFNLQARTNAAEWGSAEMAM